METQEDTIFVQNLGRDIDMKNLSSHFGSIGMIKVIFNYFILILVSLFNFLHLL